LRTIGVVTTARSDYGIWLPVLRRLATEPGLRLQLIVGGMHLSPEFGRTATIIESDGFPIAERVELLLSSDSPEGIAKSMGLAVLGFAQALARMRPDVLAVLGDRFEMHAAALAALPFRIPVAHIHGGEVTQGAIDDALRHSITKLSHLHFVATDEYARRVVQLGEQPWRVIVCGAPALDHLASLRLLSPEDFHVRFGIPLEPAPLVVTYHPVTLEYEQAEFQIEQLLSALAGASVPIVFTMPNADTHGRYIAQRIREFVSGRSAAWMVDNLGTQAYFSLLRSATAMVGNSSSGLIEGPSFGLPVVNVGSRQDGRVRAANVIDVDNSRESIIQGLARALDPRFRKQLAGLNNPYGTGTAAETIVRRLAEVPLDDTLCRKEFFDVSIEPMAWRRNRSAGSGGEPHRIKQPAFTLSR
jgi:UDP-hydrolysing UDP-N-acetyl-D-glucosamine 2-epimerase